jgi:hypothetical protein
MTDGKSALLALWLGLLSVACALPFSLLISRVASARPMRLAPFALGWALALGAAMFLALTTSAGAFFGRCGASTRTLGWSRTILTRGSRTGAGLQILPSGLRDAALREPRGIFLMMPNMNLIELIEGDGIGDVSLSRCLAVDVTN